MRACLYHQLLEGLGRGEVGWLGGLDGLMKGQREKKATIFREICPNFGDAELMMSRIKLIF